MEIWTARVPLVCFNIVEWHFPDRVRRQFGWFQCVPEKPIADRGYHSTVMTGRSDEDWRTVWALEIELWNNRRQYIIRSSVSRSTQHYHNEYGDWYRRVTRRFMTLDGAAHVASVRNLSTILLPIQLHSPHLTFNT